MEFWTEFSRQCNAFLFKNGVLDRVRAVKTAILVETRMIFEYFKLSRAIFEYFKLSRAIWANPATYNVQPATNTVTGFVG